MYIYIYMFNITKNQSIKEIVNRSYYIKLSAPFQQKELPRWFSGKDPHANAGDAKDAGFITG